MNERHSKSEHTNSEALSLPGEAIAQIELLQRELDAMRDQLAWSNRLSQLGELAAALAHEYNNLLTPIGGYAQLALARPGDEQLTRRALKAAVDGVAKARRLSEATLGLAGPGTIETETSCDASRVVKDAIACLSPVIKAKNITLESQVGPDRVLMDALALEQVLVNLMSNACNAMEGVKGSRQITLASWREGSDWVLKVSDTGPGIAEAVRGRLFEPFVTTRVAGSSNAGSGLGLSICKRLIESVGGKIYLSGPSDRGATFQIEVPLAQAI